MQFIKCLTLDTFKNFCSNLCVNLFFSLLVKITGQASRRAGGERVAARTSWGQVSGQAGGKRVEVARTGWRQASEWR